MGKSALFACIFFNTFDGERVSTRGVDEKVVEVSGVVVEGEQDGEDEVESHWRVLRILFFTSYSSSMNDPLLTRFLFSAL